jgi:hypothetical protein
MGIFGYLFGGSEPKATRGSAPTLGQYRLDMRASDVFDLAEVSAVEKDALQLAVEFRNERLYHAPPADFAGSTWEIMLGTVDGWVYKVSALVAVGARDTRNAIWGKVDAILRTQLGAPSSSTKNILIWDTEDGNVVLNRADSGGVFAVVITLTSRAVTGFARTR